ncbi:hypothetical protein BDW75DRAFT_232992 [Aspergillus navahoensis]
MIPRRSFLAYLLLASAAPSAAWTVTRYATMTSAQPMRGPATSTIGPVKTTAPLTVSPVSTTSIVEAETLVAADNLQPIITVSTEILVLPNRTDLPVTPLRYYNQAYEPESVSSIRTNYYFPLVISNLPECTLTEYTYTEAVSVQLPDYLVGEATEANLALYKTTYVSGYSTNLGGQVYTTTWCDVYLNSNAVPNAEESLTLGTEWLTECVDPRSHTCSQGENTAAAGSGGCRGEYPPTSVLAATTTAEDNAPEPTGEDDAPEPTGTASRILSSSSIVWALALVLMSAYVI